MPLDSVELATLERGLWACMWQFPNSVVPTASRTSETLVNTESLSATVSSCSLRVYHARHAYLKPKHVLENLDIRFLMPPLPT